MPAELLKIALSKRRELSASTNGLRLINGKGDGLNGLTVDRYNRHFVIQIFNNEGKKNLDKVKNFILSGFEVDYLILKNRTCADGRSLDAPKSEVLVDKAGSKTEITEYGLKFAVDLNDTVNTGLFLDMRKNRRLVARLASGKTVLNCFAYTCSFGVYCRTQKASKVINIDISRKNLDKGKENYNLNNIEYTDEEFARVETVEYLQRCVRAKKFFDLIILDPPSFSRYKEKIFTVKKEMPVLVGLAVQLLKKEGVLFAATNFTGISTGGLKSILSKCRIPQKMLSLGQDIDFPPAGLMKESYLAAILAIFK